MGQDFNSFLCNHCGDRTMHVKPEVRHGLHIVLSILTAGIWLIPYVYVIATSKGYRCSKCGSQPSENATRAVAAKPAVAALPPAGDAAEQVKKLHALHLSGAISEAEYDAAKRKALGL